MPRLPGLSGREGAAVFDELEVGTLRALIRKAGLTVDEFGRFYRIEPGPHRAQERRSSVNLILDNDGTHKTALIRPWLAKRLRFHLHFTPMQLESGQPVPVVVDHLA